MSEQHSKPVRMAASAYRSALADKYEAAARMLERISDECGGEGINVALMAWCDWYADHSTDGQPGRPKVRIDFIRTDTGQLDDQYSERLPAEIRWAGELVSARAAMDHDKWRELIGAMPTDGAGIGRYVLAVLRCVATTVNGLPRGYARMGQAS